MSEEKAGGTVGPPGSSTPRRKDPYAQYTAENPQPPGRFRCIDCRQVFPQDEMVSNQRAQWRCWPCARKVLGQA